jgi:hypothetical protein
MSATAYSREITAREVTLASGKVQSWSLGRDFRALRIVLAPVRSQAPAAYLLGEYGVSDLGIYTFVGTGPQHISGALQSGPLGQMINGLSPELALAPNHALFGNDPHGIVQLTLAGAVVDRWPFPNPIPGTYRGPQARGEPDGHTLYGFGLVLDSAGDPFAMATNGLNAVVVDLKRGKRADLSGLGFIRDLQIRPDGQAFAIITSFAPLAPTANPGFCGLASDFCQFTEMDSLIELDTRTMQLTARYALPGPSSAAYSTLLLGGSTVDVLQRQETFSTLLTLNEQSGTFIEHRIPVGWTFSPISDWAGNVYLVSHTYPQVLPASGARNSGFQDRLMLYERATGKTTDVASPLRPPPDQELLALLFRN